MAVKPRYQMKLNLSILKHLGIGLYSNSVAVITEAVANAWDADAKKVKIVINDSPKTIEITDTGDGMALDDVNDRFLNVGYGRRADAKREDASETSSGRRVMGRKGLGKLSLFAIAQTVEIYTRKKGQDAEAFALDVKEIELAMTSDTSAYAPKVLVPRNFGAPVGFYGTMIRLSNLKASRLVSASQLKQRLARRFAVIGPLHNFDVQVNGSSISTADRKYLSKVQYIWKFGTTEYLAELNAELLKHSGVKRQAVLSGVVGSTGAVVNGWIGTSAEPGDLAADKQIPDSENYNSIILMARGRPIQENILGHINDGRIYTKYLVGEINADFLDADELEDIATSSRQSIIEDDDRFVALRKFIVNTLSQIASDWSEFRLEDGQKQALDELPILNEWLETLVSPDQKKSASKLLARIQALPLDKGDDRGELFKHGILAFERLRMKQNLTALDSLASFDSHQFRMLVEDVDQIEQTLYLEMIQERLGVIESLNRLKDANALEKEIQHLVFERLWLIDPSWERGTDALVMEQTLGKAFRTATALSTEEAKGRLDIYYKRSAMSHVIIELKRAGRKDLTYAKLYEQGSKYVSGLKKGLVTQHVQEPHIQVIFLLGAIPKSVIANEAQILNAINARCLTYNEIVINASVAYKDYLEKKGALDPLRKVIAALDNFGKGQKSAVQPLKLPQSPKSLAPKNRTKKPALKKSRSGIPLK